MMNRILSLSFLLVATIFVLCGCSGTQTTTRSLDQLQRADKQHSPDIVALLGNQPILRSELESVVFERAGKEALEQRVLDLMLERELQSVGLIITDSDIEHERRLLSSTLPNTPNDAQATIEQFMRDQSFGPQNFELFLERNAILRILARNRVQLTDNQIQQAQRIQLGTRYDLRLCVFDTYQEAVDAIHMIESTPADYQSAVMTQMCLEQSIHSSAHHGGLIKNVSSKDDSIPPTLATILMDLKQGHLSPLFTIDQRHAFVYLENIVDKANPTSDQLRELEEQLTKELIRQEMSIVAQELLDEADLIVTDKSLHWSWSRTR